MNLCKGDQTSGRVGQRLGRGLGRRLELYPRSRHVSLLCITCVTCHVSRGQCTVSMFVCKCYTPASARHRGPRSSPGTAAPWIRRWQTCVSQVRRCLTTLNNTSVFSVQLALSHFKNHKHSRPTRNLDAYLQ